MQDVGENGAVVLGLMAIPYSEEQRPLQNMQSMHPHKRNIVPPPIVLP
jgi:hypothetical protein